MDPFGGFFEWVLNKGPKEITMGVRLMFKAVMALGICLPAAFNPASGQDLDRMCFEENFRESPVTVPVKGFKAYGGTWELRDGVLSVEPGDGPKLISDEPEISTGDVGTEILFPDEASGSAGLIVKVSRPAIGSNAFNGYEVALDIRRQHLRLGRHRQNFEHIKDTPCPVPVKEWISLVVRMRETTLEVLINGKTVIVYQDRDKPLISGHIGIRPWQRRALFRNLWTKHNGIRKPLRFEAAPSSGNSNTFSGWKAVSYGSVEASFIPRRGTRKQDLNAQEVAFLFGSGAAGIQTAGPDGAGIPLTAKRSYQGHVMVRSEQEAKLFVCAETADSKLLDEAVLAVAPGLWRNVYFSLTPSRSVSDGRLSIKLKSPGCISIGRVVFEPEDWAWPETLKTKNLPPIALVTRHPLGRPNAISCDIWQSLPRASGCSIRVVDPAHPEKPARTLFADPNGCIYDMNISYNAKTLFFSYRRSEEQYWHLWQINVDGTGLKQLTDGPYHDISPCLMPNGEIVFVSTRRFGYTVCQPGPTTNLYVMGANGGNLRCVSMNTLADFSPQMLSDGRVLFTRWEYVDRDLTYRQSLWTQNPDGTAYQLFFGNTIRDVGTFWQARPLPGSTDRLVATFAPHHGWPHGAIGLIDRKHGVEGPKGKGFVYISKEFPSIQDKANEWSYRDPFPLNGRSFLCSYGGGDAYRFRTYLLDANDNKRLLYEDPEMGCYFPMPLQPVEVPHEVPSRLGPSSWSVPTTTVDNAMGTFLLVDVYQGLAPTIEHGRVKSLRVMEQVRKTEDLDSRAYDQSPVMSYGTYYAKRCWGTVPVEADGSAHFRAPALREIYFQVLDAEGRELQRMTSAVQLMPGEQLSCVGCHEPRDTSVSPDHRIPLAALEPPRDLIKPDWGNEGIVDFVKLVQPVLDKYCVKCHSGADPAGGYDLSGDKTRLFNMAYDNLLGRSRSYRQHDMLTGEMLASEKARGKPLVHFFWLLYTPSGVNQPLWTGSHASRLISIIESDHGGQTIPRKDRQRIYMWLDGNVPYYGTYANSRPASPGKRDLCSDPTAGQDWSAWYARDFAGVYNRRCASCHGKLPHPNNQSDMWDGRLAWINFTRPHLSPALTAHLPKEQGGRGISRAKEGQDIPMFANTEEADCLAMLNAIRAGKSLALETPRADMPGFQGHRPEP